MLAVRLATKADLPALERLAGRDSAQLPSGELLIAAERGELRAALSLATGEVVADPFAPTAHVVAALRAYAGAPARQPRTRSIFGSYRGSAATSAATQRPKMPTSTCAPRSTAAGRYA